MGLILELSERKDDYIIIFNTDTKEEIKIDLNEVKGLDKARLHITSDSKYKVYRKVIWETMNERERKKIGRE